MCVRSHVINRNQPISCLKTHFVSINSEIIKRRRNPALLKPPWNTFDNSSTECKLGHSDPGQSRHTPATQAKVWAHRYSGQWRRVSGWEVKDFICQLRFNNKAPHQDPHSCLSCVDKNKSMLSKPMLIHHWAFSLFFSFSFTLSWAYTSKMEEKTVMGQKQMGVDQASHQ